MGSEKSITNFELMVMLALIQCGAEAYGVPITQEIERYSGHDVAVGSVYAALERLEARGLITSKIGEPTAERGGRAKRYFKATPKGLKEIRETRRILVNLWKNLPEVEGSKA
jgi:PadR family transcriptional regulator, regulatory protein PadR